MNKLYLRFIINYLHSDEIKFKLKLNLKINISIID